MSFALIAETAKEGAFQLYNEVLSRIWLIIKSIFNYPEMLWVIAPIAISMVLISYYFGKYKKEELGWNTAFGNSIVMIFAGVDLLRYLYNGGLLNWNSQGMLVAIVMLEGIVLTMLDFMHALPKSFAFALSSGVTVNTILIFLIIIIYGKIPLDYVTALAITLMAFMIVILLRIMQIFELPNDDEGMPD